MDGGNDPRALLISLAADLERYTRDLDRAEKVTVKHVSGIDRAVKAVEGAFDKAGIGVTKFQAAVAAVGAGAALNAMRKLGETALKTADDLMDSADALGIGVENLQAYRFAAMQSGVETEKFDASLKRFADRAADAARGQGELAKVAKAHGLQLTDSNGVMRSSEELLREYADLIKRAGTEQDQIAMATAAFGREGAKLVVMLKNGSAGLDGMAEAARAAGAVIENDLVAKGAAAADQLDAVRAGLLAAFNRGALSGLTDGVDDVATTIDNLKPRAEEFGRITSDAFEAAASAAKVLADNLELVESVVGILMGARLGAVFGPWGAAIGAVAGGLITLRDNLLDVGDAETELANLLAMPNSARGEYQNRRIAELQAIVNGAEAATRAVEATTGAFAELAGMQTRAQANVQRAYALARGEERRLAQEAEDRERQEERYAGEVLTRARRISNEGKQIAERHARDIEKIQEKGLDSYQDYVDVRRDEDRQVYEDAVKAAEDAAEKIDAIWDEAARDMFDMWRDSWRDLLSGKVRDFDDMAKQMLRIGLDLAANLIAAQTWNGMFGGVMQGAGGAMGGGAGGGAGGLSSLFSGAGMIGGGLTSSVFGNFAGSNLGASLGLSTSVNLGAGTTAGAFNAVNGFGNAFNNLTSPAGIFGGMAGSMLSGALFNHRQGPGASIGGTLGAMAGSFIPVPFLGTALGSFVGSTIGGAFGPRPSDMLEGTGYDLTGGGGRYERDLGPGKDSPQNRAIATQIEGSLMTLANVLTGIGATLGARGGIIEVGNGNSVSPFHVSMNDASADFGTAEQATSWLLDNLVGTLTEIPEQFQAAVDRFDPSNVEGFIDEIMRIQSLDTTMEGIADEIARLTDPKAWDIARLNDEFDGLREAITASGYDVEARLALVDQLYGFRLDDIESRYGTLGDATDDAGDDVEDLTGSVEDLAEAARVAAEEAAALATTTMESVEDQILKLTDPRAWEINNLDEEFKAYRATILEAGVDVDARLARLGVLYGIRLKNIEDSFSELGEVIDVCGDGLDDTADAADAAADAAAAAADALSSIVARAQELIEVELDGLATQRAAIEENLSLARSVYDSIAGAKRRFATDPRLGNLSNQDVLTNTMGLLEERFAAYLGGDQEAGAEIADLAVAAQEANRTLNASGPEATRIQSRIMEILNRTQSYASNEIQIQQMSLDANLKAVDLLQQQLDVLRSIGSPAAQGPTGTAKLDAIVAAFAAAGGGAVVRPGTQLHSAFEEQVFGAYGEVTDVPRLLADYAYANTERLDPTQAGTATRRTNVIGNQLKALGVTGFTDFEALPSFASGGSFSGGVARIHNDELLYTGPPARVFNRGESAAMLSGGAGVVDAVDRLAATLSLCHGEQVAQLVGVNRRLEALESNAGLALAFNR